MMKKSILILSIIAFILSGCAQVKSSLQAPAGCNTSLAGDAANPVEEIMPRPGELPEGFQPVPCDRLVEDEGYSPINVARLYGITQSWPNALAVFTSPTQKVYFFAIAPIYVQDRISINNLINSADAYAAFRMLNAGIDLKGLPQAEKFGEDTKLGSQMGAFRFDGRFNELNLKTPQAVKHDLVLVRRDAVIFGIESVYGTAQPPALSGEQLLDLAAKMDERLKNVVKKNDQLKTIALAPTPDWTTADETTAQKYADLAAQYPDLPAGYTQSDQPSAEMILTSLGSWMGRAVSTALFIKSGDAEERVQAILIFPLDAQEQDTLKRLLQSPDAIASYLIKPLTVVKALSPSDNLKQYYTQLPDAGALSGIGDAANGFTLTPGELTDTALVLVGRALVVVTVSHPEGRTSQVSAAKYAAWLAEEVKNTPVD